MIGAKLLCDVLKLGGIASGVEEIRGQEKGCVLRGEIWGLLMKVGALTDHLRGVHEGCAEVFGGDDVDGS
ncbi:hypothetical protein KS4_09190 [Poriferisphaera corsica]|uniref:Uncharacterized protein n=1 Tax=Poriferisphaera corsica TaxID=2528020 RepID=A0A517YRN4_9BACT|nr:hypothetical protein KS4_09190 [Poriferisphaera corsica]